jgi:hypothetical protein
MASLSEENIAFVLVNLSGILWANHLITTTFHQFMQAKFADGGSSLSLNQFLLLSQLP